MQRVLGIDPGLRITGYAVVETANGAVDPALLEAGVIKLAGKEPIEHRLEQLHNDLRELIVEHRPNHMAVENIYAHYRHPRTAILMAHARGVILLAAQQHQIDLQNLPSTEVKKAITGFGHASKQQMQLAIQSQCRLEAPPQPPDVADAIAIALTCARRLAMAQL